MPRYKPAPISVASWVLIFVLVCVGVYILWVHPLVTLCALLLVVGNFAYERIRVTRHLNQLKAQRLGESLQEFPRERDLRDIDTYVVRAVYEEIRLDLAVPDFPLRWSDNLYTDLLLTADEVDDVLHRIALRAGRCLSQTEQNPLFGKIVTVGDLIAFFNHQPKDQMGIAN